jgi:hypothetical protein
MTKNFRLHGRLVLLWLLFAALLLPALGFSRAATPACGSGEHVDTIWCWEVSCTLPVYIDQERADLSITLARRLYVDGGIMMYVYAGSQYFIFGKDSLLGIRYDGHHQELTTPFGVDSLKRSMVPYLKQYDLFKKGIGRLVATVSHAGSGQLRETYCDINWGKHPNSDSCYVTYSDRLNFLPREMSLDERLDSLYQKRLCEFKMIIHPHADQQAYRMVGRSEWIWKLEEVRDFKRDTIQSYFSRYLHDTGTTRP